MVDLDKIGPRIIIEFGGGSVYITESVCYEIILALILMAVSIWLGSGLKKVPKGKQIIAETLVGFVYNFAETYMSKREARIYAPFIGSMIVWLVFANATGLIGLRPITADLNVTAGMALVAYLSIQIAIIREKGLRGKISKLADPYPFMIPLDMISDVVLPITLALRLFGNIFGGMVVVDMWMGLMEYLSSLFAPVPILRCITVIPCNLFFDVFEPLIQGYVFTLLTTIHMGEGLEDVSELKRDRLEKKKKKKKTALPEAGAEEAAA